MPEPRVSVGHYDPVRERRAELRAQALLRSCVNPEEWAMYSQLGLIRVWGRAVGHAARVALDGGAVALYAYLIYPYRPIVAYVPDSTRLLGEYCVAFGDGERGTDRLPPSDDVLAKWLALIGDERRLIATANVHPAGRQLDPVRVRRDLAALAAWERGRGTRPQWPPGSLPDRWPPTTDST
ncbi:MAG: hypothetical protein ABSG64_06040 [Solirubrobacteraceae bacterium]|jgi:hypothetical protein